MKTLVSMLAALLLAACANKEIVPPSYVDDATLRSNVQSSLSLQPGLQATDVTVEAYNGEVRLQGFLPTQEQIDTAVAAARSQAGVRVVKNELLLKH